MRKRIIMTSTALLAAAVFSAPALAQHRGPLTLEHCIVLALQSHPRIEAAVEKLNEMDAAIHEASAARMPKLSGQAAYTRLIPQPSASVPVAADLSSFMRPDGGFGLNPPDAAMPIAPLIYRDFEASGNVYTAGVTLTHVLYSGGRIANAKKITEHGRAAADWQRKSTVREIRRDVTKAYYQALAANKGVVALDSAIAMMEVMMKDLSNAVEMGIRGEHDLLQAQVQLANQQLARRQAATGAQMAHDYLAVLIGVPVNIPIALVNELQAPESLPVNQLQALQTKAIAASTDLKALEEQLKIIETSLHIISAANIPTVAAAASYSGQGMGGLGSKHEFDWENKGTLSVALQWNIYEGGAANHKRGQALSQKRQLELMMSNIRANLEMLVKNSLAALEDAFASLETNQKSIAQAKRSYEISYDKFQEGMMLSSELLNAQNVSLQAEISYYAALSRFYSARADVDEAYRDLVDAPAHHDTAHV